MRRFTTQAADTSSDPSQLAQLREEVLQFSAQALDSLATSLRLKPRDPAAINLLCNAKTIHGGALGELGRRTQGREVIEEAIRQRRNLIADYPSVPVFRKELGRDYRELAEVVADDPEAARAAAESAIPLRRYGDPAEFGRVAAFVLSPAASYLTGSMIAVEGGALRSL